MADRPASRAHALVAWATFALLLAPLLAHAYLGTFSRYMADDYCTAGSLRRLGFWDSQVFWYTTWSGRYTFTFLVNLAEVAGPWVARVLPAAAIAGWTLAAAYAWRRAAVAVGAWPAASAVAAPGAALVFAVLDGAPSAYQSLYWQTGMITYTLPLLLLTGLIGWLLGQAGGQAQRPHVAAALGTGAFTVVTGGLSETYAVLQAAFLGASLVVAWLSASHQTRPRIMVILAAAFVGSIVALGLIYIAPGTAIRRGLVSDPMTAAELIRRLLPDARLFVARTVKAIPITLAATALLTAAVAARMAAHTGATSAGGRPTFGRLLAWLILLPPATAFFVLVSMAPYEFAVDDYPDARVLITGAFVLAAGIAAWGFLWGVTLAVKASALARRAALPAALAALALFAIRLPGSLQTTLADLPDVQSFAQAWGRRDETLRAAAARGVEHIQAASLSHMGGLEEIGYDPEVWVNRCVAQTYGLKGVVAK